MKNDLTKMLGIDYPIIQGGMMGISNSPLVAAVSNAGGLGTLGQNMDMNRWHDEIKKTRDLTEKPFALNLPMHTPELPNKLDIILKEEIKVVVTAAGSPARLMDELKGAGITVMHVVANVKQAVKVESAGVDAIIAEGGESGGMVAKDRVSTMVLIPAVVDAVKVPVVAAGGIADARGLVAAMALGAQGVQIGTKFIATDECDAPDKWKQALVTAKETDTKVVPRGNAQGRVLKEEIMAGAMAGVVTGLIDNVETTEQVIKRIIGDSEAVLKGATEQISG